MQTKIIRLKLSHAFYLWLHSTIVQNLGGCHAAEVTADTHNLFEEIPSLELQVTWLWH
jgi:hypothetical protein